MKILMYQKVNRNRPNAFIPFSFYVKLGLVYKLYKWKKISILGLLNYKLKLRLQCEQPKTRRGVKFPNLTMFSVQLVNPDISQIRTANRTRVPIPSCPDVWQ